MVRNIDNIELNAWIVLICDPDTATWTVAANCSVAKMGADEAEKRAKQTFEEMRTSEDTRNMETPAIVFYTGDYVQF